MKRKGAISVSTNTLIVLIVSVLVLGLIIGLVVNWFDRAGGAIDFETPDPSPVSSQTPVTAVLSSSTFDAATTAEVRFRVLNTNTEEIEVNPTIACAQDGVVENIQFIPSTLGPREQDDYTLVFRVSNTAPADTHLCSLAIDGVGRADLTFSVR